MRILLLSPLLVLAAAPVAPVATASACEDVATDWVPVAQGAHWSYEGPVLGRGPETSQHAVVRLVVDQADVGGTCLPSGAHFETQDVSWSCQGTVGAGALVPAATNEGSYVNATGDPSLAVHVEGDTYGPVFQNTDVMGGTACAPVPGVARVDGGQDVDLGLP